jgi:hypothetical protein
MLNQNSNIRNQKHKSKVKNDPEKAISFKQLNIRGRFDFLFVVLRFEF